LAANHKTAVSRFSERFDFVTIVFAMLTLAFLLFLWLAIKPFEP